MVKLQFQDLQFKLRVKHVTSNTNNFSASPLFTLDTNYSESPYEFTFDVPSETTSIQFQLICGGAVGTYYFDDFSASLATLNLSKQSNFLKFIQTQLMISFSLIALFQLIKFNSLT